MEILSCIKISDFCLSFSSFLTYFISYYLELNVIYIYCPSLIYSFKAMHFPVITAVTTSLIFICHVLNSLFLNFLLLFNYSCVPFLPIPPPHHIQIPLPTPLHPPPWFCPCVLYSSSCNPLSSLSPPHSPRPNVRLFLTSMSLVIFCFLFSSIYYVPVNQFTRTCAPQCS